MKRRTLYLFVLRFIANEDGVTKYMIPRCTSTENVELQEKFESIDSLVNRIDGVSTLPQIAGQVMTVARDPHSGAKDLKKIVESDPALSGRILRSVNSAAYGLSSKITSLHQAISFLGFAEIRNLALTASVAKIFQQPMTIGSYQRTTLWRHMVSVGICARLMAMRLKFSNFEDYFLAGLLHDIGIILEDQYIHDRFCQVIDHLDPDKTLVEVEEQYLGFNHARLGGRIAEKWNFPASIQAAIRFHHLSANYRGQDGTIVRCIEIANVICTLKGISSMGQPLARTPLNAFQLLNLSRNDIVVLAQDLDREIALNENLFEM